MEGSEEVVVAAAAAAGVPRRHEAGKGAEGSNEGCLSVCVHVRTRVYARLSRSFLSFLSSFLCFSPASSIGEAVSSRQQALLHSHDGKAPRTRISCLRVPLPLSL